MRPWLILLACIIFSTNYSHSQSLTTEGKDFWFGFMENNGGINGLFMQVHISTKDTTNGIIEMPLENWEMSFSIKGDTTLQIDVPTNLAMRRGNGQHNNGIHLTTDADVSVYLLNMRQYSSDATVVLPTETLGTIYYTMNYEDDQEGPSEVSEFLIVANQANTKIEINPADNTLGSGSKGNPFQITLDAGETYQVQSNGDLTGSKIITVNEDGASCKTFSVFSGHKWTRIGSCGGAQDHLLEQMLPISTWGKEFTVVPFKSRSYDFIRIVASNDDTEIRFNSDTIKLNAGAYYQKSINRATFFQSNKPVMVAQFSTSQSCDNAQGDPFMVMVSPNEQLLKSITFNALEVAVIDDYYINVITSSNAVNEITLDEETISEVFIPVPGQEELSYAQIRIDQGVHRLQSETGFIAYVYGFGNIESFGYSTGFNAVNLNLDIQSSIDKSFADKISEACIGSEVSFTTSSELSFESFDWVIDNQLISGDTISYQFNQAGNIPVTVVANSVNGDCASSQRSAVRIKIIDPQSNIIGPISVCPFAESIDYTLQEYFSDYQYDWSVSGGELATNSQDSIQINWGGTNDESSVNLVITDNEGCTGSLQSYPVKINVQLDPAAPWGFDSLCSDMAIAIPYQTTYSNGSVYEWDVLNGNIVNDDTTHNTSISWSMPGIGKVWFHERSTVDSICEGTSDTLKVIIEKAPANLLYFNPDVTDIYIGDTVRFDIISDPQLNYLDVTIDNSKTDSISTPYELVYVFECEGIHTLSLTGYTGTICENIISNDTSIIVRNRHPEIEVVTVDDESINVSWSIDEPSNSQKLWLQKLESGGWQNLRLFALQDGSYQDSSVNVNESSYQYRLSNQENCYESAGSLPHQSILLQVEPDSSQVLEEISLEWNEYINWPDGVQQYETLLSIDGGDFQTINKNGNLSDRYVYNNRGIEHCFQIKAVEANGNNFSLSNIDCEVLIPKIHFYNIITPNQDAQNEFFTIDNIEQYSKSVLSIYNRFGKVIYQKQNYQNDWNARIHDNPPGVYFWHLDLNEPRAGQQTFKGTLTVLY